jgi:hypothetical protein
MTTCLRRQNALLLYCISAACLLLAGHGFAESKSMDCGDDSPKTHVEPAAGDQNSGTHLQLSRKISTAASIDIDVCSADLTVVGSKSDALQITLDIANPTPKMTAVDYVWKLDVNSGEVKLQLRLPKHAQAKVVVAVPAGTLDLKVNLVRGDLTFETDRIGGDRDINVVHGHVDIEANPDSFASMKVNTVMGSFHDHRLNKSAHGLVSQSVEGTGKGAVNVNVVMGSIDLKPWD